MEELQGCVPAGGGRNQASGGEGVSGRWWRATRRFFLV
ncbi:hypothetical protein FOVG_19242 [Fusarium oxysporum f. sp. pisi HDV247]|uniref:Uncharacterized protein n=1 Tax=Fusarium oxysporum f. sp. pisi HDV247 TaxID=1080344 RepID=W9NER3_FUSOX|nr:hypothetical protein FOVG_19242 [Fusarium oxysporum f. sp. pisi HDV247]